jgi:hypothetical protein
MKNTDCDTDFLVLLRGLAGFPRLLRRGLAGFLGLLRRGGTSLLALCGDHCWSRRWVGREEGESRWDGPIVSDSRAGLAMTDGMTFRVTRRWVVEDFNGDSSSALYTHGGGEGKASRKLLKKGRHCCTPEPNMDIPRPNARLGIHYF